MIWAVLKQLPRLIRYSFLPQADGAYSRFSMQRIIVMLLFWPVFLTYLIITGLCLWLDNLIFPHYKNITVRKPVMVIGIPRSGTTFLHRLLAGDQQRFTTMTLQELIFAPSILQRYIWIFLARLDAYIGSPIKKLIDWIQHKIFSGLDGVHSTRLNDPEEDYLALAPVLSCFLLILPFGDPAFMRLSFFDAQATESEKDTLMRFYRGLVQRHLFVHGEQRTFLSKNPSFTPMYQTLARAFPDARFVACLRTPNEAVPSQVSSILIGARLFSSQVNKDWWRKNLMDMLQFYYSHLINSLPELGSQRHAFVRMEILASAPAQTINTIYTQFQFNPSNQYQAWLTLENDNARHYKSGHQYQGDALGIAAKDLQSQFNFVYTHLGYAPPEYFETQ